MKFSYAILFALAGWVSPISNMICLTSNSLRPFSKNHSISAQQYLKMSYYKSPNCTTLVVTATPKIGQCYSDIESCRAQMGESYCTQSGIETKKIGERSSEKFVLKGDVVEYNFYAGSLDCSSTPTVQTAKLYVCANNVRYFLRYKSLMIAHFHALRNYREISH